MTEIPSKYDPRSVEDGIYSFWEDKGFFAAKVNPDKKPYSIVIPPPNITGILHMGHALNNTIQDILIRHSRMKGHETEWMPGTDHAGIATQNVVEKKLRKQGKNRHGLGREEFLKEVWKWRDEYGSTIIRQLKKLGCSCDWERTRFTMDKGLSEAVLEVFVRLYKKGLIYRGNYIINWCPRCLTALSDEEAQHKEIEGGLYHIRYPFKDGSGYVVVATTRPETMLGDVAVAVNPKDKRYTKHKGKFLILPVIGREIPLIFDESVDPKFGTGALKITPAHDPVDFEIAGRHGLSTVNVMNEDATINDNGGKYVGQDRFKARKGIIEQLKDEGLFEKQEKHTHAVGHCYRCDTMVEPRLSKQWFVRMRPLAGPAIKAVKEKKIKFYPARWTKVYLNWMENIRDWCISRQIWWGHRLPVYYCNHCNEKMSQSRRDANSPEPGVIVSKTRPEKCSRCGSTELKQDPDVLDTWFSSWLWPFSTFGWPEDTGELKYFYPTDTLVTAQEIIFFWVARMIMAGMEFMGDIPFKDVYIHGTVRDDTGTKMSKSLGNVIDPLEVIKEFGADALRFSIISITAQGQDVFLSKEKFHIGRNFANKVWNASRFILMNLDDSRDGGIADRFEEYELELADIWILNCLNTAIRETSGSLDNYRINEAASVVYEFFWHKFCDWYIEISKNNINDEKTQAILRHVLRDSLKLLHPFMPFVTEEIWRNMFSGRESVMVSDWPKVERKFSAPKAGEQMQFIIDVISSLRNMRAAWGIPPSKKVGVLMKFDDKNAENLIKENMSVIERLSGAESIEFKAKPFKPEHAAAGVVGKAQMYINLEGVIDIEKEKTRLKEKIENTSSRINNVKRKLKNKNFVNKAPKDVVEKQKQLKGELEETLNKLKENVKALG
jgi:valyl-tRNA synthetase